MTIFSPFRWGRGGAALLMHGLRCAITAVVPRVCYVCDSALSEHSESLIGQRLCDACRRLIVAQAASCCPRCGTGLAGGTGVCRTCATQDFHFDATLFLGYYRGELRDLVLQAKRDLFGSMAITLGEWLGDSRRDRLASLGIDAVVPMPMFWRRRLWRGVNGPDFIAAGIAKELGRPLLSRVLRRHRSTPTQVHRTVAARRENIRDAFSVCGATPIAGKTILLVDDVMTTGASCSEAARVLRQAGAARVVAAVAARATLNSRNTNTSQW